MKARIPKTHRGAATLALALVLAFVALLTVAFANRSLVFEQKTSANQYRATQAFETAEAGLEWTLAMLNTHQPIAADCRPSGSSADLSLRERFFIESEASAACVRNGSAWSCRCPADAEAASGFSVELSRGSDPRTVRLTATGCTGSAMRCDATARVQVDLARIPGLDSLPAAALTVRGGIDLGDSAFSIQHDDAPTAGLALHAGGSVNATALRLAGAPGTPGWASVADHDTALATLDAEQLFASVFRLNKPAWQHQPVVRSIDCATACDDALASAIGSGIVNPLIHVRHGLHLNHAGTLGTAERPVLLMVDGPVQFNAPQVIHGLVYATGTGWNDPAGTVIHGAVIIENAFNAQGSTRIRYDAEVLRRLHDTTGTFARLPGSWRDF